MKNKPNFYWAKADSRHAIMDGSPLYQQLWISVSSPHDSESIGEIVKEIEDVINEKLSQTDFSSGETTDFVLVLKDKSYIYPVFGEDNHFEIKTMNLLSVLKQWKEFISNPP